MNPNDTSPVESTLFSCLASGHSCDKHVFFGQVSIRIISISALFSVIVHAVGTYEGKVFFDKEVSFALGEGSEVLILLYFCTMAF